MTQIVADNPKYAEANADAITDALHGGRCALPRGTVFTSRRVWVPGKSELYGDGGTAGTVLKQVGQEAGPEQGGLLLWGQGFSDPGPTPFDATEGDMAVRCQYPPPAGGLVYVTDGRATDVWAGAAELRGEWRRVTSVGGTPQVPTLVLDRPLRRSYKGVRALSGQPVTDVFIHDMTIAQPEHPGAYKLLGKYSVNVRLQSVRVGVPGDLATGWGFGECGYVDLIDCDCYDSQLGVNTTHDLRVVRGRYGALVGEECCSDCWVNDTLIAPAGRPMVGLYWYLGCDRLWVTDSRIEGGGASNPAGGTFSPLAVWGRECLFRNFRAVASINVPGYSGMGGGGDHWAMEGCRLDLQFWLTEGKNVRINDSEAPSWTLFPATTGVMRDSTGPLPWGSAGWEVSGPGAPAVAKTKVSKKAITRAAVEDWANACPPSPVDWSSVDNTISRVS